MEEKVTLAGIRWHDSTRLILFSENSFCISNCKSTRKSDGRDMHIQVYTVPEWNFRNVMQEVTLPWLQIVVVQSPERALNLLHSLKTLPRGTADWLYSVHIYKPPCFSTKAEAIITGIDYNDAVDTLLTKQKLMVKVQLSKMEVITLSHLPRQICHYRKINFAFP